MAFGSKAAELSALHLSCTPLHVDCGSSEHNLLVCEAEEQGIGARELAHIAHLGPSCLPEGLKLVSICLLSFGLSSMPLVWEGQVRTCPSNATPVRICPCLLSSRRWQHTEKSNSELITFRITKAKAKAKFWVKYLCKHQCQRSSVPININTKAKARTYFRGINFTLISMATVRGSFYRGSFRKGVRVPISVFGGGVWPVRERKKTHKHKQICGIVPGLRGCQKVVYVFFFGSFLMGEEKHINKIPPKIPGQSRENFVYVFCSLCVFFVPYWGRVQGGGGVVELLWKMREKGKGRLGRGGEGTDNGTGKSIHMHLSKLPFSDQHFYFSHRPSPLLKGRRLSGSWRGSVLSRFSVGCWSVLVIFDRN